jgi:Gliding motility associated protein GldN
MLYTSIQKHIAALALLLPVVTFAQTGIYNTNTVWKKLVTHEITLKEPHKRHPKKTSHNSLAEIMVTAIKDGYVPAYSHPTDSSFPRITAQDVNSLLGLNPDSTEYSDYNGKRALRITPSSFTYDSIYTFRLL